LAPRDIPNESNNKSVLINALIRDLYTLVYNNYL